MSQDSVCRRMASTLTKVLIVDDEPTQRALLKKHLSTTSYEIIEAENGAEAFAVFSNDPDIRLVITDLMMPELDGFGLIKKIRETELHYTYIIVQTHRDNEESLIQALSLGADDYLTKPVRPVELRLRLEGGVRKLRIEKFEELVFFLTKLAALQSKETGSHLDRIYHFSRLIARDLVKNHPELGLTNAVAEEIARVSPLHDLGKVGISVELLHKEEKLTSPEVNCLQSHAQIGGNLIKEVHSETESEYLFLAHEIAMLHHERWDGNGYPFGLAGKETPICARIVSLADAYDAMTSKRSYHPGLTHWEAKDEIIRHKGKQFDPVVVEAFLRQEEEFLRIKEQYADEDTLYK